jgi:hypothetical protein
MAVLDQFMTRFGLMTNDVADSTQIERPAFWSAVHPGEFTLNPFRKLAWITHERGHNQKDGFALTTWNVLLHFSAQTITVPCRRR